MSANVVRGFFEAADRHGDRAALIEGRRLVSYAELAAQVRGTAAEYARRGLKAGDRVLVFVPMSTDLYRVVLALFSLGAVAVFLDEWVSFERLELCCRLAKCRGVVAQGKLGLLALLSAVVRRIHLHLPLNGRSAPLPAWTEVDPDAPALITFTTGSTGTPKAALRSHRFLQAQFDALAPLLHPEPDVCLTLLPVVLFLNLGLGKTSVLPGPRVRSAKKFRPQEMAALIARWNVETLIASPFFVRGLAELGPSPASPVKRVFSGGAPLYPSDARLVERVLPGAAFTMVYGSTEAEPVSHLDARAFEGETLEHGLLVGTPHPAVEVRIVAITDEPIEGADLERLTLPAGEVGEICVAGPHVLETYFENTEAQARNKIRAARLYHRTGDAGFLKDGRLYLVGRANQVSNEGGMLRSPFLLEGLLRDVEGVTLGAFVDRDGGLLAVEASGSEAAVRAALAATPLRDYPVRFVRRIPRDPRHYSKIDYEALGALLARQELATLKRTEEAPMGDKSKQKKEAKKAPAKTMAEKKKEKDAKKASRPTSSEA